MKESIHILLNGRPYEVTKGTSVAAAIMNSGSNAFRQSPTGEPRGPVCGMGICYECRVRIDGVDQVRSCLLACKEGMEIWTLD